MTKKIEPPVISSKERAQMMLENFKKQYPEITSSFLRWEPASEEFKCPTCAGPLERTVGLAITSPWAGSVRCTKCEYKSSVAAYLGQSVVKVEPLPLSYTHDYLTDQATGERYEAQAHEVSRIYPACVHTAQDECHCACHSKPFLHDRSCCDPCLRCGFRVVVA